MIKKAFLRRATLASAVVAVAAAGVATARADAPTITTFTRYIAPTDAQQISAACGFTVLQTFTIETRRISFTDNFGNEVRRIGHSSFDGYLIKSSTGEALPWHGVWTQTLDVAAGTITIDGLRQDVHSLNGQSSAMMVGHAVYVAADFPATPIDESTRADFADWWAAVCPLFTS
jgi:hypothetical protein